MVHLILWTGALTWALSTLNPFWGTSRTIRVVRMVGAVAAVLAIVNAARAIHAGPDDWQLWTVAGLIHARVLWKLAAWRLFGVDYRTYAHQTDPEGADAR
ncbi:hypothetical protein ABN028_19480 [Actinopolymorpha sp. B17G11]|uniref:hypothetical protein n=1 Tax=Actinopolymorpha sp. B17G11 TaxID=3160861 RepID=UPI0032E506E8